MAGHATPRWRWLYKGCTRMPGWAACPSWVDASVPGPTACRDSAHLAVFSLACRAGLERRGRAQCNKAPFMYEMKGALSGRAASGRLVPRLPGFPAPPAPPPAAAARRPPVPSTHVTAGYPAIPVSPRLPWTVPVSNGESISTRAFGSHRPMPTIVLDGSC